MRTPLQIELLNISPEACLICRSHVIDQYVLCYESAPFGAFDGEKIIPIEPIPKKLMRLCKTHKLSPGQFHPLIRELDLIELARLQHQGGYLFLDGTNQESLSEKTRDQWFATCKTLNKPPIFITKVPSGFHVKWMSAASRRSAKDPASAKVCSELYHKLGQSAPWKKVANKAHHSHIIYEKIPDMFGTPIIELLEDAEAYVAEIYRVEMIIRDDDLFLCQGIMES